MAQLTAQGRAQTFVLSSGGRLHDVGLYFSEVAASGPVTVLFCKTDGNNPDQTQVVAQVTKDPTELTTSGRTAFTLSPEYVEPGRYSVNILSNGNHKLRRSGESKSITQGEHYAYTGDNQYVRPPSESDRHIAFDVRFQEYASTKFEIDLQPAQMAGGMDSVQINGLLQEPDGTDAYFMAQIGGQWQTLTATDGGQRVAADFSTRPPVVPLRVVFEGTLDKMPGCFIGGNLTKVFGARTEEEGRHVSDVIVVPGDPVSKVRIVANSWGFVSDKMTLTMKLIVDGVEVAATDFSQSSLASGEFSHMATFVLGTPASEYQLVIEQDVEAGYQYRPIVERALHFVEV